MDDGRDVGGRKLHLQVAGVEPRDVQQLVDDLRQPFRRGGDEAEEGAARALVEVDVLAQERLARSRRWRSGAGAAVRHRRDEVGLHLLDDPLGGDVAEREDPARRRARPGRASRPRSARARPPRCPGGSRRGGRPAQAAPADRSRPSTCAGVRPTASSPRTPVIRSAAAFQSTTAPSRSTATMPSAMLARIATLLPARARRAGRAPRSERGRRVGGQCGERLDLLLRATRAARASRRRARRGGRSRRRRAGRRGSRRSPAARIGSASTSRSSPAALATATGRASAGRRPRAAPPTRRARPRARRRRRPQPAEHELVALEDPDGAAVGAEQRRRLLDDLVEHRARLELGREQVPVRASCCESAREVRSVSKSSLRSSAPRAARASCCASSRSSSANSRGSAKKTTTRPPRPRAAPRRGSRAGCGRRPACELVPGRPEARVLGGRRRRQHAAVARAPGEHRCGRRQAARERVRRARAAARTSPPARARRQASARPRTSRRAPRSRPAPPRRASPGARAARRAATRSGRSRARRGAWRARSEKASALRSASEPSVAYASSSLASRPSRNGARGRACRRRGGRASRPPRSSARRARARSPRRRGAGPGRAGRGRRARSPASSPRAPRAGCRPARTRSPTSVRGRPATATQRTTPRAAS